MKNLKDKYINVFTDFGFKKLFGTEFNKPLLINFLNELLGKEAGIIKSLSFLSTEQLGRKASDRKAIFDIYCENESGEKFIVELQKAKQNYFKDRSVYYSTFPIQQQAEKGQWDFELKAIYTIGILDFVFDEDKNNNNVVYSKVQLMDVDSKAIFYDKLTYIYLEMPKFNKTESQLETRFDKWLYILKNLHELTNRPQKLQELIFKQLFDQAEIAQFTDKEYDDYEYSLKEYRDLKNTIDTAFGDGKEEGRVEGKVEGKVEGREEGRVEGIVQGIELGIEEGEKTNTVKIAKKMIIRDDSNSDIMELTGLTFDEIEELRNS